MAYLDKGYQTLSELDAELMNCHPLWQSPFDSPAELCASYKYHKGGDWAVDDSYLAGRDWAIIRDSESGAIRVLQMDASGKWWLTFENALGVVRVDEKGTQEIAYLKASDDDPKFRYGH